MSNDRGIFENDHIFVVSDLHLSDPLEPSLENFVSDKEFERFVTNFLPKRAGGRPSTLVIAGDFLDFARVRPHDYGFEVRNVGATEAISLEKAQKAIAGHPVVFEALRSHLASGGQLVMLAGNHDVDLFWPGVRAVIAAELQHTEKLAFPDRWFVRGAGVYIEHGHQYSYDNRFERFPPFAVGGDRLERAWGTFFMESVYNQVEDFAPWINKVHPTSKAVLIALQSLGWDKIPPVLVPRLLGFFLKHGKRMAIEHAMGTHQAQSGFGSRAEAAKSLGIQLKAIDEETWKRAEQLAEVDFLKPQSTTEREPAPNATSLGRNDERGLKEAAHEQLARADVHTAIFGHTHRAHRNEVGKNKAWINTGTWTGYIPLEDDQPSPTFDQLTAAAQQPTHRRTYAYVGPSATPGVLETFDA